MQRKNQAGDTSLGEENTGVEYESGEELMGRLGLAFRVFFDVLFNAEKADKVRALESTTDQTETGVPEVAPAKPVSVPKPVSARSDALTLLETLQREARFLDFIQEDIQSYSDQQIGSAIRDVHRGCRAVFDRHFHIVPATSAAEGSKLTVQGNESAQLIRLVGKVNDQRPVTGTVVHQGWKAERCELPVWTGNSEGQLLLAPAEIEVT